jgi:Ser/Thr protein kinase RdoA (MazF antagonist)
MENNFLNRIGYQGKIDKISHLICKDFDLGRFKSNKIITKGYEDFNYILETDKGNFFVKIFAKFRDLEECNRYIDIMQKSITQGVQHPKLLSFSGGFLYTKNIEGVFIRLCVTEFIRGNDFFSLGVKPKVEELKFLANQTALINSLSIKPKNIYDEWAIINFGYEFKKKSPYLSNEDLILVKPLLIEFNKIDFDTLPFCFVHGDLISTNIMKEGNKLWVIDFAAANYYPRIQELAVIACDICFDTSSKEESINNFNIFLEEYQRYIPLTNIELITLPLYIKIAHAMHLLCANYEKQVNNNTSKENEYFLNLGRSGLKQSVK